MLIAFFLSMPGCASWNGRWSGEGRNYVLVRRVSPKAAERFLHKGSCGYNFGDGWYASVNFRQVDGAESRRLRRQSAGFAGYDWMVTSIIADGAIYGPTQPKPETVAAT